MDKDQSLYHFLQENSEKISQEWYDTIEETDGNSVYAAVDPSVVEALKKQNLTFNYLLNRIFNHEEDFFYKEVKVWAISIAEDKEHQRTPIYKIIREFMRVRNIYLSYIKKYSCIYKEQVNVDKMDQWRDRLIKAMDYSVNLFVEESFRTSERQIDAQKEMIYELSSPVILLHKGAALLPLIGDIDTERARIIMDSTLQQCTEKHVTHLFLDLSGVLIIDTMVAFQLSQLMTALKLIGVQTTISGIRPEIAQTSIQLGISFDEGNITSTLAQAVARTLVSIKEN
ncbi:STAS domain-containing protein [Jeotgalibacillus sp. S-D1]|uniref:STAS domain-containing protein n=1 Tax=Jeotgalibacillus sp. S-D1 TaxID=2552189 RepID=UPI00105A164B|nr:STAS domain-containing protein [Jeotgalibacillus sp. S-D1]TDL31414.1 STAS domain-containing protein [Jeotgalibacillus sp. S-D1]